MPRKLIVGYEDDEHGGEALALARALTADGPAEVVVANVLDHYRYIWESTLVEELTEAARQQLASAAEGWPDEVAVSTRAIAGMSAAGGLHRLAQSEGADLIVLGPTRRGAVEQSTLGTTAEQLLHGAPCPVALAPPGYERPGSGIRTVAVAYDGSAQADAALDWAADAARTLHARLRMVAVVEPPPTSGAHRPLAAPRVDRGTVLAALRNHVRGDVDRAIAELAEEIDAEVSIREGDAAAELRAAVASDVDLLVVGSRGFGPVRTVLLGTVSGALARSCAAPAVFVPRPPATPPARAGAPATNVSVAQ